MDKSAASPSYDVVACKQLPSEEIRIALFTLRLVQPLAVLLIVLIAIYAKPGAALAKFIFAPHPNQIKAATTKYGTNINGTGDGSIFGRHASNGDAPTSSAPMLPTLEADATAQQPVPVVVPVRSRRRILTLAAISALAATYLVSGAFIVLLAVIPPHEWAPAHARWQGLEWQALLGLLAWCGVAIAIAYEEATRGRGHYGRGKAAWSTTVGFITDLVITALYLQSRRDCVDSIAHSHLWVIGQLSLIGSRLFLIYPLTLLALQWDRTTFVRASELAQRGGTEAATTSTSQSASERSALLGSASPKYGATSTLHPKAKASSGQASTPSGTRSPNPNAANASMGLALAAQPPPPTFTVFFERIRLLFPYLWPSQSLHLQLLALFCVALLIIGRFVNLFVPLTLGKIVSDLAEGSPPWWHISLYAGLKMLQGSGGLVSVLQALAWLPIEQFSDRSISIMAFDHLLHLSMAFHTKKKMGEILRILDRGAVISSFFQYLIFNVVPIFVDIAVAMIFLGSTFGPPVGIAIFAVMFLYTYVSVTLTTWRTSLRREANNKDSISRAIHADVLINYELVKVHSNEPYELDKYRAALLDYQMADYRVTASLNLLNLVQNAIITTSTLVTCLIVARSVVNGKTKASDFVVFITYLQQVYVPLGFLGTLHRVLMQNLVDTDKLMTLLEEESDVRDVPGAKDLVVTEGVIEFRDVVFSYDNKVQALKGVNFTVNANESAALVGESGAGKSSIMRLLYRFYDIQEGQIFIDGQDISRVKQASLRKAIGIVPQEPGLFNTSIYQNILYGDINATDEQVEAAARAAQIYERIQSFPEGWRTVVGERGVKLSGGEKQRVALARTFLKNPKILLLDEATSALDTHTEKQLQTALKTILQGRTSLTIAHRLSTIVNSDRIVVLDNGRVVENGSHPNLIGKGGLYHSMWMQQIKTDEEARQGTDVDAKKM
jgi:ATP-binding cassette subfamily B (MDR/TAP) protein 6